MPEARLIWIDMEMSGLDPAKERILEIATVVTDDQLEIIAEGPELVLHQEDGLLAAMDDWNQSHHGASGLTERVRASGVDEAGAEQQTLEFLREHTVAGKSPLCGNSIHQDRRFISAYMPDLDTHLHYRHVDVSTLKELVQRWHPKVFSEAPAKRERHRALDDIHESLEELRYYKNRLF